MSDWLCSETIQAAFIQGGFTLLAGLAALGAGYLAYSVATGDLRLKKIEQESQKRAYRQRIKFIVKSIQNDIIGLFIVAQELKRDKARTLEAFPIHVPEDVSSTNWEKHSLLSADIETYLYELHKNLIDTKNFLHEVSTEQLSYVDVPYNKMLKSQKKLKDGGIEIEWCTVGEQYIATAELLANNITDLLNKIEQEDKNAPTS